MGEAPFFPVVLEKGEKEVRNVDGVEIVSTRLAVRGRLLLTDRRLIFNGRSEWGVLVYETSLDNVVGCDLREKFSLFGRGERELLLSLREVSFRVNVVDTMKFCRTAGFKEEFRDMFHGREKEVTKIWETRGQIDGSVDGVPAFKMVDGIDKTFGGSLRRSALCMLAACGIEDYKVSLVQQPIKLVLIFKGIKQPEMLKSEIMEQVERYRRSAQPQVEKCSSCGTEIPAEAIFCPSCGIKVK